MSEIYLTLEQIKDRPEDEIVLDGTLLRARDPFSVAQIQQKEELNQDAPPPYSILRILEIKNARRILHGELALSLRELEVIGQCHDYVAQLEEEGENARLNNKPTHNFMVMVARLARGLGL